MGKSGNRRYVYYFVDPDPGLKTSLKKRRQ